MGVCREKQFTEHDVLLLFSFFFNYFLYVILKQKYYINF